MYIRSTPSARDMDCPAWAVAMASVGSVGLSAYKNRQKMSDRGLYHRKNEQKKHFGHPAAPPGHRQPRGDHPDRHHDGL